MSLDLNEAQSNRPQSPMEHISAVIAGEIVVAKGKVLEACILVIMKDHRVAPSAKYGLADRMFREIWGPVGPEEGR